MRRELVRDLAKVLVAFDIRTESLAKVDLPNVIDNRVRMDLVVLREHFCLSVYVEPRAIVWIMRRYGSNRPWDLLFSLRDHWWSFRPVQSLAYFQYDHRVLVEVASETKTVGWYNLGTDHVEQFHMNGMPSPFVAATCLWY
ncbi:hypothetical protein ACJRO7_015470 [Eucalyptus globulus]|uniref:F-box associated domain-containing protein n=1 Tax=Eucalyptus globulus TaxID=34317 RepID=A0ABD3L4A3_EUCGL